MPSWSWTSGLCGCRPARRLRRSTVSRGQGVNARPTLASADQHGASSAAAPPTSLSPYRVCARRRLSASTSSLNAEQNMAGERRQAGTWFRLLGRNGRGVVGLRRHDADDDRRGDRRCDGGDCDGAGARAHGLTVPGNRSGTPALERWRARARCCPQFPLRYIHESNANVPGSFWPVSARRSRRSPRSTPTSASTRTRRRSSSTRAPARRVAGRTHPGCAAVAAQQSRVSLRDARARPRARDRRVLLRWHAFCLRPRDVAGARLRQRGQPGAGFSDWKRNGYEFATPKALSPRAANALFAPSPDPGGRRGGAAEAARVAGAADRRGGLGSPASLYLAAARVGYAGDHRRRRRRRLEPAAPDRPLDRASRRAEGALGAADDRGINPDVRVVPTRSGSTPRTWSASSPTAGT